MLTDYTPETLINQFYDKSLSILKSKTTKIIFLCASLTGLFFCILILIPQIQNLLIRIAETKILQRELRDIGKWKIIMNFMWLAYISVFVTIIFIFTENKANLSYTLSKYLFILLYAFYLIFISVYSYHYGGQWLNSDHASEMMLGKLLAEENALLSRNWYYSTEIRLVYQTIFTMPLFKLLGQYENWALIRSLNIFLNNIVLILSYIFLAKQINIRLKYILITSIFLVMPLTHEYWDIVIFGGYYSFLITYIFLTLGLFIKLSSRTKTVKEAIPWFVLFSALSLLLGIQGIRSLLCVHIPLLITCILLYIVKISKIKWNLFLGSYGFILCGAGYLISNLLHSIYIFHSYTNLTLSSLHEKFFKKLFTCLIYLVEFFGYNAGNSVFSIKSIFSIGAIICTFILFWAIIKIILSNKETANGLSKIKYKFMMIFFITSVIFNIFIFTVTNYHDTNFLRYFIPFMILYIPVIAIIIEQTKNILSTKRQNILLFGIIIFIFGQNFININYISQSDVNSNRKQHIQYLLDNNLSFGFATFWNANVTTELTNGKIEINSLYPLEWQPDSNQRFINWYWLKPLRYNYTESDYQKREPFLLLTKWEYAKYLITVKPDYEDDNYIIIRFPSSEVILRNIQEVR